MFKETNDGQTHSFNDGCGMPEHNNMKLPKNFGKVKTEPKKGEAWRRGYSQGREELIKELLENMPEIIIPEKEPPKNKLSQSQIFGSGQVNMLIRVKALLKNYLK